MNALRDQVFSLPELVRTETWRLEADLRKVVPTPVQHGIRQILLTGCGDSAIAGSACEGLFRTLVGVPTLAAGSMEIARYVLDGYAGQYPHTPFVIATSSSGEVARTVEAARRAKDVGGYVLALTGDPTSRLGRASDVSVNIAPPRFPDSPGMRSYVSTVIAHLLLAIRFAEVRGRITMDEAQALRAELAGTADAVQRAVDDADARLPEIAQSWVTAQGVEFLGSGPSRASAAFGSAKILEAVGKQSAAVDVEEFVHLQYFERASTSIATVLIAAPGSPVASRADEVARELTALRRPWIALGPVAGAPTSLTLPEVRQPFTPIVEAAVLGLLAAHLQVATGETAGRGSSGPWAGSADGATTRNSSLAW